MDFKTRYQYNHKTDLLGRGGFAAVYKAQDTLLSRTVALKFFTSSGDGKHTLIQEISRAISLDHANLCRYYDAALLESVNMHGDTERIEVGVMEYIDGGDLKYYLKRNQKDLKKVLIDVLEGLSYLHKQGIIHRDLKPQNILVKNTSIGPVAKITDFGISKHVSSGATSSSQLMGTVEYMAPEQFSPTKYGINGRISTNLDLWSFGLMVYELIIGESLFGSRGGNTSAEQVMSSILNDDKLDEKIKALPEPYQSVVKECLVKDARLRVQDASDLIALLKEEVTPQHKEIYEQSGGSETMVIPRPVEDESNAATVAIDIADIPQVFETPKEPEKTHEEPKHHPVAEVEEEEKPKKKSPVMIIVAAVILIAAAAGFWYYHSTGGTDSDYQYAKQHYGDTTTEFLPRLIKSAQNGNDSAALKLASYYLENKKFTKAITTVQPLADKKLPEAITLLDSCQYSAGMSLYNQKNYSDAYQLFIKSAAQNNAQAECMLGNLFYMGQGAPEKSSSEALKWYLKSAEQKNDVAMYCVGMFYADGTGVEKNKEEANKYLGWVVKNAQKADVKKAAMQKLKILYSN